MVLDTGNTTEEQVLSSFVLLNFIFARLSSRIPDLYTIRPNTSDILLIKQPLTSEERRLNLTLDKK